MKLGPTVQRVWNALPIVVCCETCQKLGLSAPRLSNIVAHLRKRGMIEERATLSNFGRPTRIVSRARSLPTQVQMLVYDSIRNGNNSSRKIATDTGVHVNHVSQIVKQLIERRMVRRGDDGQLSVA